MTYPPCDYPGCDGIAAIYYMPEEVAVCEMVHHACLVPIVEGRPAHPKTMEGDRCREAHDAGVSGVSETRPSAARRT